MKAGAWKFAHLEWKNLSTNKIIWVALCAIAIMPLLYGALYLAAFEDPYERLNTVPVAVVNEDAGAEINGEEIQAGRDIVEKLAENTEGLKWNFVSAKEAQDGLEDGSYFMTCTIPRNFSEDIASVEGADPKNADLLITYNEADNLLASQIGKTVWNEVRSQVSANIADEYWTKIFDKLDKSQQDITRAADGSARLNLGINRAFEGSSLLSSHLSTLSTGSERLEVGLKALEAGSAKLNGGAQSLAQGSKKLEDSSALLSKSLDTMAQKTQALPGSLDQITVALAQAEQLSATNPQAAQAILRKAQAGVGQLKASSYELTQGLGQIQQGAHGLQGGITKLHVGAEELAGGATKLNAGIVEAQSGSATLSAGAQKLSAGSGDLTEGLSRAADGSSELTNSLREGASKAQEQLVNTNKKAEVMADPVQIQSDFYTSVKNYGTGFAPYFMALGMWVGAVVAGFIFKPLNRRLSILGRQPLSIALAGYIPLALFALVQATLLMLVLQFGLRLQIDNVPGFYAMGYLTALSFAAIMQMLTAAFKLPGKFVAIILLMLQLTACGGTFPIQTTPDFFQAIHPFMPMTYVVEGMRQVMTGVNMYQATVDAGVLLVVGLACFLITSLVALKNREVRMDDLHPLLQLG